MIFKQQAIPLKYLALEKCNSIPNLDYNIRNPSLYLLQYMARLKKWKLIIKILKVIDHPYIYFKEMIQYCVLTHQKALFKESFPTFYQMDEKDEELYRARNSKTHEFSDPLDQKMIQKMKLSSS